MLAILQGALNKTLRTPETRQQLEAQGVDIVGGSPAEFAAFLKAELDRHAKIIKAAGGRG